MALKDDGETRIWTLAFEGLATDPPSDQDLITYRDFLDLEHPLKEVPDDGMTEEEMNELNKI